jgi:hypothetical protein
LRYARINWLVEVVEIDRNLLSNTVNRLGRVTTRTGDRFPVLPSIGISGGNIVGGIEALTVDVRRFIVTFLKSRYGTSGTVEERLLAPCFR